MIAAAATGSGQRAGASGGRLRLRVQRAARLAEDVRAISMVDPAGAPLPSFTPGSHLLIDCGSRSNAYSLTGRCDAPAQYSISVRLDRGGAGGSRWLHEQLAEGDEVTVSPPRSAFAPVRTARRHLFVAGGIGITPFLSHLSAARLWGDDFQLLYAHRPGAALHTEELEALCGARLLRFHAGAQLRAQLARALLEQPLATHLYVCGPSGLIDWTLDAARRGGWPEQRLHWERFAVEDLGPGRSFTARLRSGRRVPVPSGVSLLEALEHADVPVANLCRQGVCGECRLTVRAGRVEHRDLFLSASEREAGASIMSCVSRCEEDVLELDL